ncbi:hypothetical protein [Streptomyces ardesiacus]|uniref:hypothetical protein n=1 Tax=Streptomyces ardesiacus TaxID=285564 RepID=UPI002FDBA91C
MTDQTTETARALLDRHGLPEDVIDGALCLHAQELAAEIREETRRLKAHGVLEPWKFRPCRDAANQIDPTRNEDDVDPDETAVPLPPADRTALRDRIADALTEADGWVFAPGFKEGSPTYQGYLKQADAVLAVLPAPADRTADTGGFELPGDTEIRTAALREVEAALSERAERLTGEYNDSDILHEDGPAATVATWKRAAELVRRVADETAATETQAAAPVCICGHPEERHFEDVCQTCGCGDYLEPGDAAEVIERWRQAALKARAEAEAQQEVDVDTLARLMCDADVHVNNGDYPGWDDLSKTPGLGQDEVRKAARYLLKRLHIAERQPAAGARQDGAQRPGLRERHRAAWNALTPEEQTARLAELDAIDEEQDGPQ